MNSQYKQRDRNGMSRAKFLRALTVEALENRRLLAADFSAAVDGSTTADMGNSGGSVAAEVDNSASADASAGVDGALLATLASSRNQLAADVETAGDEGDIRLASLTVELPNGQSFGLTLYQSGMGQFRLTVSNSAMQSDLGSSLSSTLESQGSFSPDSSLTTNATVQSGSTVDASSVNSTSVSVDTTGSVASGSGSVDAYSSFEPVSTDSSTSLDGSVSDASMNLGGNMAAPPISGSSGVSATPNASGSANLNASQGFGSTWPTAVSSGASTNSLNQNSLNDNSLDGSASNLTMNASGEMEGGNGSDSGGSTDSYMSSQSSDPRSGGWVVVGGTPSSHPMTPEEMAFQSRA